MVDRAGAYTGTQTSELRMNKQSVKRELTKANQTEANWLAVKNERKKVQSWRFYCALSLLTQQCKAMQSNAIILIMGINEIHCTCNLQYTLHAYKYIYIYNI